MEREREREREREKKNAKHGQYNGLANEKKRKKGTREGEVSREQPCWSLLTSSDHIRLAAIDLGSFCLIIIACCM
jgi:hypothetical protein